MTKLIAWMEQHDLIEQNLTPGSDEWHDFRFERNNASEAAAMLGLSKNVTRTELLHAKSTGDSQEFTQWVQENILDHGHHVEALARPIIEKQIGRKLFPVVCSYGKESVSCDGLTMASDLSWEHKQWSESLAESISRGVLPEEHKPQCYQNLMITGAKLLVFTVSDGTEENMVSMEVLPDAEWFEKILSGWEQFAIDKENYQHVEEKPIPTGKAPETLPALLVEVKGMVTASNLSEFKETALSVFGSINKELETDEDFSNAEKTVKWCKDVEGRLEATKEHALSQTASIDELFKTIDDIKEKARATRLDLDKLVKARKAAVRVEIKQAVVDALSNHITALNKRLGNAYMPLVSGNFAGVMKGLKTVSSLRNAVDTELSNLKIEANTLADSIQVNLESLKDLAADHKFLFSDTRDLVLKNNDDLVAVIKARISDHEEVETKRREEEREKIRLEEQAKLEAQQPQKTEVYAKVEHTTNAPENVAAKPVAQAQPEAEPQASMTWSVVCKIEAVAPGTATKEDIEEAIRQAMASSGIVETVSVEANISYATIANDIKNASGEESIALAEKNIAKIPNPIHRGELTNQLEVKKGELG